MNKKLSWTKIPPKEEGYYWIFRNGGGTIIHVDASGVYAFHKGDEFYGPLQLPPAPQSF